MSAITNETAQLLGINPTRRRVNFTGIDGVVKTCPTAKINLWLPGEQRMTRAEVLVGASRRPDSKCQGPAQEVKFLGVWWIKGAASVPQDTLKK